MKQKIPTVLFLLSLPILFGHAADVSKPISNQTELAMTDDSLITRKERLNFFGGGQGGLLGLLGGLGGQGGGGSGSSGDSGSSGSSSSGLGIQQGLKGIQSIQKFISRFQNVMKVPFSFRGVTDTMTTLTGLLAAVGGGYLTYVSMVALFGSMLDPQNTAYQYALQAPPHQYVPNQVGAPQSYNRRQSSDNLYFGSINLNQLLQSIKNYNYPEASFKLLRIKDEACKQRAVCEFEKFLAKKGVASVILKGVSKKITGMEKYLDAAYRGLGNQDCSYAFACPHSLGQTLLKSIGLS